MPVLRKRTPGSRRARLAAAICLCTLGCTPQPAPRPADADPQANSGSGPPLVDDAALSEPNQPGASEPSVRPLINQPYFAEGALQRFTGVLEAESREVVQRRHAILRALELRPGSQVADVGAGTGLFTLDLARQVGADGRVFAVDIVPTFLAQIQARATRKQLHNVVTVLADARSVALPDGSIDLAFLCDVYHHLEYPESYLASLRRALKPLAKLVIIDFERVPGVTKPSVLEHVRAGRELVVSELQRAGFRLLAQKKGLLKENYFLVFESS
jgi:ubiquinone/menaquinone biosynthesis C-methylase UbiE